MALLKTDEKFASKEEQLQLILRIDPDKFSYDCTVLWLPYLRRGCQIPEPVLLPSKRGAFRPCNDIFKMSQLAFLPDLLSVHVKRTIRSVRQMAMN